MTWPDDNAGAREPKGELLAEYVLAFALTITLGRASFRGYIRPETDRAHPMHEPSGIPPTLSPSDRIAGRYAIERELGRGGMATVYLVRDTQYDRLVALKLLSTELSAATASDRFRREIQIVARLNHPNIVALLDSGSYNGALYYVMPRVEGESLRGHLRRAGQLDVGEAITIARQVALALAHAHRQGVIHRDIKPDNILLHEGQVLVADFGIALALDTSGMITATGTSVGTPAYMSPEQVSGERGIDARSDIYSLGCVLYEMLVGDVPHSSRSANVAMARKLADEATRPRAVRPTIPQALEKVVLRALARAPADRFASADDFVTALDKARVTGDRTIRFGSLKLAAVLVVVILAWPAARAISSYAKGSNTLRALAILPCADLRQNRSEPYLVDALTHELIGRASQSGAFDRVIALPSVERYRGASTAPSRIGAELGVDGLLYCEYGVSAESGGEGVRVQLVRSRDASLVWSAVVRRNDGAAQPNLATLVLDSLTASRAVRAGSRREPRSKGLTTSDPEALRLYKEGRFYLAQFQQDALRRSIRLFREAIARDSAFALPSVALSHAYLLLGIGHSNMDEREAFTLMRDFALRALAINDEIAEAHLQVGAFEVFFGFNWRLAERELTRAIELDPNLAAAFDNKAILLGLLDRTAEADAASNRAIQLSPVDPIIWGNAGVIRVLSGRSREAIPFLEKGLELASSFHPTRWGLGIGLVELGEMQRGVEMLRVADSLSGHAVVFRAYHAWGLARAGEARAAREILAELMREEERIGSGKNAAALGQLYLGLGVSDSAFLWLERAYQRRSSITPLVLLGAAQRYRRDPRHQSLMRRLGLPLR
jgi:TolB-like protein